MVATLDRAVIPFWKCERKIENDEWTAVPFNNCYRCCSAWSDYKDWRPPECAERNLLWSLWMWLIDRGVPMPNMPRRLQRLWMRQFIRKEIRRC